MSPKATLKMKKPSCLSNLFGICEKKSVNGVLAVASKRNKKIMRKANKLYGRNRQASIIVA